MAQIYKEQVNAERKPTAPETDRLVWAEKNRLEGINKLDDAAKDMAKDAEILAARDAKAEKAAEDMTKKALLQQVTNARVLHPKDENAFQEMAIKNTKPLWEAVPEKKRAQIVAELSIEASGDFYQVKKGQVDRDERSYIETQNALGAERLNTLRNNAGVLVDDTSSMTAIEKARREEAALDWKMTVSKDYDNRLAKDQNGNNVFSDAYIAQVTDLHENAGYHATIDWASDAIATNYAGVVAMRDKMVNDPAEWKRVNGASNESFDKTKSGLDGLIAGRVTGKDLKKIAGLQLATKTAYDSLELDAQGNVKGRGKNNINSIGDVVIALSVAKDNGAYATKEDQQIAADKEAKADFAMIRAAEKSVGAKGERWWIQKKLNMGKVNAGEVMVGTVQSHIKDMAQTLGVKPESLNNLKAEWYAKAYKNMEALDIKPEEKGIKANNEMAEQIVNGLMIDYVDANVAKVELTPEQKKNPAIVKNAVLRVMNRQKNEADQAIIDRKIQGYDDMTDAEQGLDGFFKSVGVNVTSATTAREQDTLGRQLSGGTITPDQSLDDYLAGEKQYTKEEMADANWFKPYTDKDGNKHSPITKAQRAANDKLYGYPENFSENDAVTGGDEDDEDLVAGVQ